MASATPTAAADSAAPTTSIAAGSKPGQRMPEKSMSDIFYGENMQQPNGPLALVTKLASGKSVALCVRDANAKFIRDLQEALRELQSATNKSLLYEHLPEQDEVLVGLESFPFCTHVFVINATPNEGFKGKAPTQGSRIVISVKWTDRATIHVASTHMKTK